MASHLVLLIVFAVLTSAVFAMLQRDTRPDQVRLFVLLVAGFVGAGLALGWLLYLIPPAA